MPAGQRLRHRMRITKRQEVRRLQPQPVRQQREREHARCDRQAEQLAARVQLAVEHDVDEHAGQRQHRHVLHEHRQPGQQPDQRPLVPRAAAGRAIEQQQGGGLERQQRGVVVEAVAADVVIGHERGERHRDQRAPRRHELAAEPPGERQRDHDAELRRDEGQCHRRPDQRDQPVQDPRRHRRVLPVAVLEREGPDELLGAVDLGRLVGQAERDAPQQQLADAQQRDPGEHASVDPRPVDGDAFPRDRPRGGARQRLTHDACPQRRPCPPACAER